MKPFTIFALTVFAIATAVIAAPTDAPHIDSRIEALQARIDSGLKSGKLTQTEGNSLNRELDHIKKTEEQVRRTGTITPRTRANLRRDLEKLEQAIERKEHSPNPASSPSQSPAPSKSSQTKTN